MKKSLLLASRLFALPALISLSASFALPALAQEYEIDGSHSGVGFSVRHLMVSNVRGEFSGVKGKVVVDDQNPSKSSVEASIDTATVDTREAKRDDHLRNPDFLNVEKFPLMTYKSKKVERIGAAKLKVTGDLTLHGVTKEVVLDVDGPSAEIKDPWGNLKRGASASAKLNRKDFGLTWNKILETGGVAVGDEVTIVIDIEMQRKA